MYCCNSSISIFHFYIRHSSLSIKKNDLADINHIFLLLTSYLTFKWIVSFIPTNFMEQTEILGTLGNRIRMARLDKKLTQQHLAKECEIEKAMISRIENGQTNLTVKTLLKISKALEVPLKEFF